MPTVPQYQRQSQTQTAPVMTSNLRVPENPLVQGIQQAADTSINMMADAKRKADVALSQDALLQFNQFGDDQFNNPDNGLITKQERLRSGKAMSSCRTCSRKLRTCWVPCRMASPSAVIFSIAAVDAVISQPGPPV
jgi:hypothetical protein